MTYPDLVAGPVVQNVAPAHVELPSGQSGGDGNLPRKLIARQVRRENAVVLPLEFTQAINGVDLQSHHDADHPGGVGDGAAAHANQSIGAGFQCHPGNFHRRLYGSPLSQAGESPN